MHRLERSGARARKNFIEANALSLPLHGDGDTSMHEGTLQKPMHCTNRSLIQDIG